MSLPKCSICLDDIPKAHAYVLECYHVFHRRCVQKLIKHTQKNIQCPLCREIVMILEDPLDLQALAFQEKFDRQ